MSALLRIVLATCVALASSLPPRSYAQEPVLVFAAASLQESLTAAADAFATKGGVRPTISFAASSALARQIEHDAPAALFISADEAWMDHLVEHKKIVEGTRVQLVRNRLVLISSTVRPFTTKLHPDFPIMEFLTDTKLAMADPESVPAGRYARAALKHLNVWDEVERSVVRTPDVRAALALVERDEARAGIVYETDAKASKKVLIVGQFPDDSHPPIVYPMAIVEGRDSEAARRLRDFLLSAEAKKIFETFGFLVD